MPKSNDNRFVIPIIPNGTYFQILDEKQDYMKDIPTSTLNQTIRNFNKVIERVEFMEKIESSKDFNENLHRILNCIMLFTIICALVIFYFTYNHYSDFIDTYIWIPVGFLVLGEICVFAVLVKGMMTKTENFDIKAKT